MYIKNLLSYLDIIIPLLILYIIFLIIAYIKNKRDKK